MHAALRTRSRSSLAFGLLLLAAPAVASTPPPAGPTASPPPGHAAFAPGEEIDLTLDYLNVRMGRARLAVGRPEGSVWPVIFQARTDGVGSLVDIRQHLVSYWDAAAGLSRGSDLNAIEIGDRHTHRARFDRQNGKARVQVIRKGKLRETTHDVPPGVQDLASALLFLRLQPLAPGFRIEYPVFHGTSVFTLRAQVEGTETVVTPAGRFDALRVRVQLGFTGKFETRRDSHFWLSNDVRHVPVRVTADFAIGSVTATLSEYRAGGQLSAAR